MRTRFRTGFTSMLLLLAGLSACDLTKIRDLENSIDVVINVPGLETTVGVQILDAETRELVTRKTSVTIGGSDANSVIDPLFFDRITEATTKVGGLQLGIRDGETPTRANPFRFTLHVKTEGYLETLATVAVEESGAHAVQVMLVSVDNPPEGAAGVYKKTGQASSTGETAAPVTVTTPTESESGAAARVHVPEGTKLADFDGNPLQGDLSVSVTYFNSETESSLAAFPGGFDHFNVGDEGEGGAFVTAGFTSVELKDASGREAANLSKGAQIELSIPRGTFNPETGALVRAGDLIPFWSLVPGAGEWKREGEITVQAGPVGNGRPASATLAVSFETRHFSYFSLGWLVASSKICGADAGTEIRFDRVPKEELKVAFSARGFRKERAFKGQVLSLYGFPRDVGQVSYTVSSVRDLRVMAEGSFNCGQKVNVSLPSEDPDRVRLELALDIVCGEVTVQVNYPFYFKRMGDQWSNHAFVNGQVALDGLVIGERYSIGLYFQDKGETKWSEANFVLTEDPVSGDLGSNIELVSSERTGQTIRLHFRVTDIDEVCANV